MRIEPDQLCVDYNGTVALYDASLRLPEGCICGLVGMNGAGKSTLFKALTGFVRSSRGDSINGATVAQAQRQQSVAYVPQNEGVDRQFPVSVWDVVMMGRYGSMNQLRIPATVIVWLCAMPAAGRSAGFAPSSDRNAFGRSAQTHLPGAGDRPAGGCAAAG